MSHIRVQNRTYLVKKPKCIVRESWEMTTMYIIHLFYIIHDQVNKIELLVDPLFQYTFGYEFYLHLYKTIRGNIKPRKFENFLPC